MLPLLGLHIRFSGTGIPLWFILIAAGVVLLSICACGWTAAYAGRKGYPFVPVLVAALFLSFPVVLLIVALAPSRVPPAGAMPPQWRKV